MIGINVEKLDMLVKKNNFYLDSFKESVKNMNNVLNNLSECYSGKSLSTIFDEIISEKTTLNNSCEIFKNYSDVLNNVKKAYSTQDQSVKTQISNINSKL